MRRFFCFAILLMLVLSFVDRLNAQPNTLYFLKGVPQTKDLNPARPGMERGFYISMPLFSKLDLSVNTNNWSYNDIIHRGSGIQKDSMVYDFKNYLNKIGKNNFLNESAALTLLEFGWKKESSFYSFSWTEHEFSEVFFTKSLVELIYYGNAPYLGKTYSSGYFGIGAQHYREISFTYAKDLNKKMSIGIAGKLLFGMAGIKTAGLNVIAGMPKGGDLIDLGAAGRAFVSAPMDVTLVNNKGYQVLTNSNFNTNSYLFNFGNPGFAVDLGFSSRVNNKLELSMSLIDLGFISWQKDVSSFSENGQFLFRGVNLNQVTPTNNPPITNDVASLFLAQRDNLRNAFYPISGAEKFTTLLPVKLYVAGEYKLSEVVTFGGVARVRMFNNLLHTSFTASANAIPFTDFSISASYSIMESTTDNLGIAAAYRFGNIQLYAATDNIIAFYTPTKARNANLRAGINFIFKDEIKQRKGVHKKRSAKSAPGCPF